MEDISKDICKAYGCLIQNGDNKGVAYRATYIINPDGILVQYSLNQLSVGRNIDNEIFRLVKTCRFRYYLDQV